MHSFLVGRKTCHIFPSEMHINFSRSEHPPPGPHIFGGRYAFMCCHGIGLQDATLEEIETMNGNCSVCWLPMVGCAPTASSKHRTHQLNCGKALACGHAFHGHCITKWLAQCHT